MNIVTIETKRGYTIKIPVWTIKGLIVQSEKDEYFLAVSGSAEPYPISKAAFDKVEKEWLAWTSVTDFKALTAINVAEQVSNELSSLIASTQTAINKITECAEMTTETNTTLRRTTKDYQSEMVGCIKDVTTATKAVVALARNTLETSETAVGVSTNVAKDLKALAKSLESINALELFR